MILADLKRDIYGVASVLKQNGICEDTAPLEQVISYIKKGNVDKFYYAVKGLQFKNIPSPRNCKINISSLQISLDVNLKEKVVDDNVIDYPIVVEEKRDKYLFSICINIMNKSVIHTESWHLDFDNQPEKSEEIHPFFHLSHGGKEMKNLELGQTMPQLTPRIPFLPMDIILGIDFIIANFYKKELYCKLHSISTYNRAIAHSQNRLWRPYLMAVSSKWCNYQNQNVTMADEKMPTNYLPYLI